MISFRSLRFTILLPLFFSFLLLAGHAQAEAPAAADKNMMPVFSLKTSDGKTIDNESIKGKPVTFLIMQTACNICRSEMADLNALDKSGQFKGVEFLVVNVDLNPKLLPKYLADNKFEMTVLVDPDFTFGRKFGITFTPAAIFVNKAGKVVAITKGYTDASLGEIKDNLKAIQ
jgi:peroxiredoxin